MIAGESNALLHPGRAEYNAAMMKEFLDHMVQVSLDFAPKLLVGVLIIAATWVLGWLARRLLLRAGDRFDKGKRQVIRLGAGVAYGTIIGFGCVTALGSMGVDVSAIVAGLGLTGFALGFALKDALSNVLSGAMILIYKPFLCGDVIAVAGCEGEVVEINLRYTVVMGGGKQHLIPNSTLLTNVIVVISARR
jgi:small conductance mechanosensitive channel